MFIGIIGTMLPMISHGQLVKMREVEPQKCYIGPSQLAITDREMFAFVSGQWVAVNEIHSDAFGVYVLGITNYPYTRWICSCSYNNSGSATTCQRDLENGRKCGRPRP
jgi:hypothetical protein